jgi:hypothetical protein
MVVVAVVAVVTVLKMFLTVPTRIDATQTIAAFSYRFLFHKALPTNTKKHCCWMVVLLLVCCYAQCWLIAWCIRICLAALFQCRHITSSRSLNPTCLRIALLAVAARTTTTTTNALISWRQTACKSSAKTRVLAKQGKQNENNNKRTVEYNSSFHFD